MAQILILLAVVLAHAPVVGGAVPEHLQRLYGSVSEEDARKSAACRRTEDVAVCPSPADSEPAASDDYCCVSTRPSVDPHMNNCGGTRPTGLPFAGRCVRSCMCDTDRPSLIGRTARHSRWSIDCWPERSSGARRAAALSHCA